MIKAYLPTMPQISREIITVMIGAIVAAVIFNQVPGLKQWIKDQIGSTGSAPTTLF